jgi:hypothetical protein
MTPEDHGQARVYVDDAFVEGNWGKWTGGGHMQADTLEALHEFAARIGLRRAWFQTRPGRPEKERRGRDATAPQGSRGGQP